MKLTSLFHKESIYFRLVVLLIKETEYNSIFSNNKKKKNKKQINIYTFWAPNIFMRLTFLC